MDSATEFLFGRSVNSMSSPLPLPGGASGDLTDGENAFVRAFKAALDVCAFRINAGEHWALWEFKGDRTRSHMKVIYDYLDPIVDEAIREKKKADGGDSETDHTTLLGHLASEIDGSSAYLLFTIVAEVTYRCLQIEPLLETSSSTSCWLGGTE